MLGIALLLNESNLITNEKLDFLYTAVISLKTENEKEFQGLKFENDKEFREIYNVMQGLSFKFEFIKENNELKNNQVYLQYKYFRKILLKI
jgi:hypothetical protein